MTKGEIEFAIRKAFNNFDTWNDVTGVIPKGSGYYYEMQGVISDAVKIGCKIACEGIDTNLDDILNE
jgi:hypothetical protein